MSTIIVGMQTTFLLLITVKVGARETGPGAILKHFVTLEMNIRPMQSRGDDPNTIFYPIRP